MEKWKLIAKFAIRIFSMTVNSSIAERFFEIVSGASDIAIVGHHNPDGDCIGCLTGMNAWIRHIFEGAGKNVSMLVPNAFPDYLKFMPGADSIKIYGSAPGAVEAAISSAELIICMDFNNLARSEGMASHIGKSKAKKVLIDHHPFPEDFADLMISETEVSSASEVAWWLLNAVSALKETDITDDVKTSLYTGMMTDTNNFCNSVFPSTFLMASQIADSAVDREMIQAEIMNSFSEQRMRLMGEVLLNKMHIFSDLKAASIVLDQKTKEDFSYRDGDSEGFVNLPLKIKDVEISALFTQSDGFIKVSLRSKGAVSVNRLSRQYFNGGGHERAAGGRLYDMPIEEAEDYFVKSLRSFLNP